ncbi:MAG: aspartate-semialdehyde dehydrogenase [Planctomycetota bacterium JB042]
MSPRRVVVVGSSGAVGRELLALLAARGVPPERIVALRRRAEGGASALDGFPFAPDDLVLFCAGASVSRREVPRALAAGARVIDLSSAFRRDESVPLVVPEVNGDALDGADRLVAGPNCTATLLCVALAPLERTFGLARIVVATYQAVSGAGARAIEELRRQTRAALDDAPLRPEVFPEPIAFNVFSHESAVDPETGRNDEEEKVIRETRRLLGRPDLPIDCTCMRVPVERAHTEAVDVTLRRPATEEEVRSVLGAAPGVSLVDDRAAARFPTPRLAAGRDDVLVGRIRRSTDPAGIQLVVCGDQLRKGAAANALAIMDRWPPAAPPAGASGPPG